VLRQATSRSVSRVG